MSSHQIITISPFHRFSVSFLWGLFCACSWTWCIGMYLPRIMIDRWGWAGFIAFAIPNVLGCAAFGYIVKNRTRSEAMIARHRGAMTWFSIVTVAYHMFFIVWLLGGLIELPADMYWVPLASAAVVLAIGAVFSFLTDRDWLGLCLLAYGVSIAAFAWIGWDAIENIESTGELTFASLGWLAPTLFFGFLLCPYLDLTFHRAIQHSPSRHAFAIFGVAFAIMLVLTCAIWFGPWAGERWLPAIALAHLLAQSAFTVGAHLREVRLSGAIAGRGLRMAAMFGPLLVAAIAWAARLWSESRELGENMYLRFLVFYGLVFPAYVLLIMIAGSEPPRRREWVVWGAVVAGSFAFYEFGFIRHHTWLLVIPLALIAALAWRNRRALIAQSTTPGRAGG